MVHNRPARRLLICDWGQELWQGSTTLSNDITKCSRQHQVPVQMIGLPAPPLRTTVECFTDDQMAKVVEPRVWKSFVVQRSSTLHVSACDIAMEATRELILNDEFAFGFEQRMMSVIEKRFRQLSELQVKLCAGNGLPW